MSKKLNKHINGQKHHYVPEVYLNNFSYDGYGNLYSIKTKPWFQKTQLKSINKSAVCYYPDNYKFNDDQFIENKLISDPNHIENNLFDYENKFIPKFSKIINEKLNLNFEDTKHFIRILLSIKNRNISQKYSFHSSPLFMELLKKEIQRGKALTLNFKLQDPIKHEEFFQYIENELITKANNKLETSDLYNSILLNNEEGKNKNHELLIKPIVQLKNGGKNQ